MTGLRKICVLTGTRAEYGLLKPVMEAIEAHPALQLQVLVTGMHLSEEFGKSVDQIRADGFEITAEVDMLPGDDSEKAMALSVGKGILGMAPALERLKPDVLLVLGDRTEILAGVISAVYMNIPVGHIHGGDITRGGVDESVRHAVTKFAHIHFPATAASAGRIESMGEDPWRIHLTGAPCLDTILHTPRLSPAELLAETGIPVDLNTIVLIQHSVSTEPELAGNQIRATLQALERLAKPTIAIYPNSDSGGRQIIQCLIEYENRPWLKTFKTLSHNVYLSLLSQAGVLVGNSSSGIIESSSFALPVVNIGQRQEGRERAGNVLDVGYDADAIYSAIDRTFSVDFRHSLQGIINPYGDGNTGKRIAEVLAAVALDRKLIQKQLNSPTCQKTDLTAGKSPK